MMYRVSSSIANFAPGLARKYSAWKQFSWSNRKEPCVFFGMYHIGDVLRLTWHTGEQTIFWCGSDILNMQKSPFLLGMIQGCNAKHICENYVEQQALAEMGIDAEIKPQLFDKIESHIPFPVDELGKYPDWQSRKRVYLCAHEGREEEYGLYELGSVSKKFPEMDFHVYGIEGTNNGIIGNVYFHGNVSQERFLEEIKSFHCGIRLNNFDGFSEVLARSALLGQYQISRIEYPHMFTAKDTNDLITSLKMLELATEPNYEGRNYWIKKLSEPLCEL